MEQNAPMSRIKVSVVIPFFQRKSGILRRALVSILQQTMLSNTDVHVIVIDDASPISAQSEIEGLSFAPPFYLQVITQANGGVAKARNAGLKLIDNSTTYIAFIDSDDIWPAEHLARGIKALENTHDFYFVDNMRQGHHESYCRSPDRKAISTLLEKTTATNNLIEIPTDVLVRLIISEFPTQASTVIYRRSISPDHLFNETLHFAGEDVVFFAELVSKAKNPCFGTDTTVECADGINMYFGNFSWDGPKFLSIKSDQISAHTIIKNSIAFSPSNAEWNDAQIKEQKRIFVFHTLRFIVKNKGQWPVEARRMAKEDRFFFLWFPFYALQVVLGKVLGIYKPT
jgi:succinoglycan biosynthesis protein ExoW